MIRAGLWPALLFGSASLVVAGPISLVLPVDCTLGKTCFIQQYVDHDPGPEAQDFTCGSLSYEGHKGTDFALPTQEDMAAGVTVRAAAAGVVTGVRDGVEDLLYQGADLQGRDCGNGVVLRHDDGWETQYCHLRHGSVQVTQGQEVAAGTDLGRIGLSGRTEFPHLHLSVRHDGAVVDPFAPDGGMACGSDRSLWAEPLAYTPGGLLDVGFAPVVPAWEDVQAGSADNAPPGRHTALVGYGHAFGGRIGDIMQITILGPHGEVVSSRSLIEKNQARYFRAAGRKQLAGGWPAGDYVLTVQVIRDNAVLSEQIDMLTLR